MISKGNILSNDVVVSKLNSLEFNFEEKYWDSFRNSAIEHKQVSVSNPVKINPKILLVTLSVAVLGIISYFAFTSIKFSNSADSSAVTGAPVVSDTQSNENPIVKAETTQQNTKPVTHPTNEVKPANTINTSSIAVEVNQSIKETKDIQKTDPPTTQSKLIATKPETNIDSSTSTSVNETKTQPAKELPVESKRKKKRNRTKKTTATVLVPDPEEDNIVVPEN